MLRSILAIVAGFLVTAVLVVVTDAVMAMLVPSLYPDMMAGGRPTPTGLLINLAYGTLYAVIGGFVMALIARRNLMKHLYWLIGVLVVFGLLNGAMYAAIMPWWYSVGVVVLGIVGYWIGVKLYMRSRGEEAASIAEAPVSE